MKKVFKKVINRFGFDIKKYIPENADGICCNIKPNQEPIGRVLLSYVIEPFLAQDAVSIPNDHTHYWESYTIGRIFLDLGYELDVISYRNEIFKPQKEYAIFLGARTNFNRIVKHLNNDCLKIVHLDTAHWLFNNHAACKRSLDLVERKKVALGNAKFVEVNRAIEQADFATILGNAFTAGTYRFAHKKIFRIPISACATYDYPNTKHARECRRNFAWFGSSGFVHKGLDLVLDVFSGLPDYHLYVCGPIKSEPYFEEAFHTELYRMPNIHTVGWVDINNQTFTDVMDKCVALVYPTCSEGGGGSVIQCMHAGVIPIASYEASVDIDMTFGIILDNCSTDTIRDSILELSHLPDEKLDLMSRKSWEFARTNHTRDLFEYLFRQTMDQILQQWYA